MSILLLIVNKFPTSMAAIGKEYPKIINTSSPELDAKEDKPSFRDFAKGNPSVLAPNCSL